MTKALVQPLDRSLIEALLNQVEKPSRYIGGEWNQVKKDPGQVDLKIALAFPDVYEIGMSYLGFKILYEIINQQPNYSAERCYSPWLDMEKLLVDKQVPLFTLESKMPLSGMDVVGITLQHEMAYTNILNLLALAHIPVEREERGEEHPLIIGGGPCVSNPEPIERAFDVFVLGDGESVFLEVLESLTQSAQMSRQDKIKKLAEIPGVYVPQYYHPEYNEAGLLQAMRVDPGMPSKVTRRVEPTVALPRRPLVPFLAATHDRVTTQLFRGCTRGCRFCQAGMIGRPLREQEPQAVIDHIKESLETTGYEEASLTSLSSGDYTRLWPVVDELMNYCMAEDVALSFPSLRIDSFKTALASKINQVRKTGLTFAPEAGSDRLRRVINKAMDENDFIQRLAEVFGAGWDLIKLYFMIGLPSETSEDVGAICSMVGRILAAARQEKKSQPGLPKKRSPRIHLGINLFIPKPHTPFQWEPQLDRQTAKERLVQLARYMPKAAEFKIGKRTDEELNRSYLEAVFARGDRRLWPVLKTAWEKGARFDSWGDQFNYSGWIEAFETCGIDPDAYALRKREADEYLAWDHLDYGVSKAFLLNEKKKSLQEQITPDCAHENKCQACGAHDPKNCPLPPAGPLLSKQPVTDPRQREERPELKMRLCYQKSDGVRFVGHLDMVNAWRRAAKRAKLPIHYSQGFHPQPSISFGPPLPLGYTGLKEWMDIGLENIVQPELVRDSLNRMLPKGLKVISAKLVGLKAPSLNQIINGGYYQIKIKDYQLTDAIEKRIQAFWEHEDVPMKQWSKKGPVTVNARTGVHQLEINKELSSSEGLIIDLLHESGQPKTIKVPTLIEYLSEEMMESASVEIIRVDVGHFEKDRIISPDQFDQ